MLVGKEITQGQLLLGEKPLCPTTKDPINWLGSCEEFMTQKFNSEKETKYLTVSLARKRKMKLHTFQMLL